MSKYLLKMSYRDFVTLCIVKVVILHIENKLEKIKIVSAKINVEKGILIKNLKYEFVVDLLEESTLNFHDFLLHKTESFNLNYMTAKVIEIDGQPKIISCTVDNRDTSEYLNKFKEIVKSLEIEDTAIRHESYHMENGVVVGGIEEFAYPERCPHILLKTKI